MELICTGKYELDGLVAYTAKQNIIYNREQEVYLDVTALASHLKISRDKLMSFINLSIVAKSSLVRIKIGRTERTVLALKTDGLNSLYSILAEQIGHGELSATKGIIHLLVSNIAGIRR